MLLLKKDTKLQDESSKTQWTASDFPSAEILGYYSYSLFMHLYLNVYKYSIHILE